MNKIFEQVVFGRGAYIVFVVSVVVALAFAGLPVPIFLAFAGAVVGIGLAAEVASRLASQKLIEMSALSNDRPAPLYVPAFAPISFVQLTLAQAQAEPEFAQIQDWFMNTAIGSFA